MNIPVLNESPRPAGGTAGMINVFKSVAEAAGYSVRVYAAFLCILLAVALILSGCTSGSVSPSSFVDRTNAPEDTVAPGDFAESIDLSSEKNDQAADHAGTLSGRNPHRPAPVRQSTDTMFKIRPLEQRQHIDRSGRCRDRDQSIPVGERKIRFSFIALSPQHNVPVESVVLFSLPHRKQQLGVTLRECYQ